ncbi:MAG: cold shock domain-containing protein [Candidatus Binatia bacterium]
MVKIMLFIDGTWLYSNTPKLAESYGKGDFQVHFGRLPRVLAEEVSAQLGETAGDVVRTHLFGSYAANYDLRDEEAVQRRLDFFSILKEEYHYELDIFPINFKGRRLRRADRDPKDSFEPKEKCVDIALATSMLYFAAIPYAYDIAIAVIGDLDFKPVLQHARRLGKRVAIASIQGSCAPEYADPRDEARVKDFDIIWLDHLLHKLELKYERHQLDCQSPTHVGERKVWTTFHPRKGQRFFCDVCRMEFAGQKQDAQQEFVSAISIQTETTAPTDLNGSARLGQFLTGTVKKKVTERGFGFIHAGDGKDYFFHLSDLQTGLDFNEIEEGLQVDFVVKKGPGYDQAGAAQEVRRHSRQTPE